MEMSEARRIRAFRTSETDMGAVPVFRSDPHWANNSSTYERTPSLVPLPARERMMPKAARLAGGGQQSPNPIKNMDVFLAGQTTSGPMPAKPAGFFGSIGNKIQGSKFHARMDPHFQKLGFTNSLTDLPRVAGKFGEFLNGNSARMGVAAGFGLLAAGQLSSMSDRLRHHQYGSAALHGAIGVSAAAGAYGYGMYKNALSNHLASAAQMFMKKI
jgi:hypothetical protein